MDIDDDILQLRLKQMNDKYESMQQNILGDDLKEYINKIKNKELTTINQIKNDEVKQPTKELFNDTYIMYNKPWNKLPNIHKSQKIEEYLSNIKEISIEDREKLMIKMTKLLNDKIITKKNEVNYDEKKGCIISIKRLIYDKNKNGYKLNK